MSGPVVRGTGRRRKHPAKPVGEGFHGERAEGLVGDVGWQKSREEERETRGDTDDDNQ